MLRFFRILSSTVKYCSFLKDQLYLCQRVELNELDLELTYKFLSVKRSLLRKYSYVSCPFRTSTRQLHLLPHEIERVIDLSFFHIFIFFIFHIFRIPCVWMQYILSAQSGKCPKMMVYALDAYKCNYLDVYLHIKCLCTVVVTQ